MKLLRCFIKDRSGVTSIEYALIAGIVSIAAIGGFSLVGSSLVTLFSSVATAVTSAADAAGG